VNPRPIPSDFLPLSPARRRRIEATIEALIALLDQADGDENLEPYLSTAGDEDRRGIYLPASLADLEEQHDDEPNDDGETCQWSIDPDTPQEGPNWHYCGQ